MKRGLWVALSVMACGRKATPEPVVAPPKPVAPAVVSDVTRGIQSPDLARLVESYWDAQMEHHPMWATQLGDHRFDDRLHDPSLEAAAAFDLKLKGWNDALAAIPDLSPSDQLNRDLLVGEISRSRAMEACAYDVWSFSARSNPMLEANGLPDSHPVKTQDDASNFIARANQLPALFETELANLRTGLAKGLVVNRASAERVLSQMKGELQKPVPEMALMRVLSELPSTMSPAEQADFKTDLEAATAGLRTALQSFVTALDEEILPRARTEAEGLTGLPQGAECYRAMVEYHTTLPLDPEAIHQTGLDEIERLHREVSVLGKRALGRSDIQEIFHYLRTDPGLYFETEEEVEAKAASSLERARAAIPEYFGRLPQADCEVKRIPDYEAPYTTIAYYMPLVPGEKPGYYFVNTYEPTTRPRHEAEVLAFHESIPGHHLQIAISTELDDLPLFRRHLQATAFVEGWGLYSEQLADEMGLYSGDTDRFGMYSFELWRASRLVVDTGIHHKGWTREEAIAFMLENTPLAQNNIENEVDRYITTPGQALAYKTGQLEIWRLRREAESRLGEQFDIKSFHDVVLEAGAVPLPILRERIEAWVSASAIH